MSMHSVFNKILKLKTILKTEQTTIVYAKWDRRTCDKTFNLIVFSQFPLICKMKNL